MSDDGEIIYLDANGYPESTEENNNSSNKTNNRNNSSSSMLMSTNQQQHSSTSYEKISDAYEQSTSGTQNASVEADVSS